MRKTTWFLLLALTAVAWTAESGAGWFDKKSRGKEHARPEPHRYFDTPRRVLLTGELRSGPGGAWYLGQRELRLLPDCRIEVGGEPTRSLVSSDDALVLGTPVGNTVLVRQVRIGRPSGSASTTESDEQRYGIQWSDSNPSVGVGTIKGRE